MKHKFVSRGLPAAVLLLLFAGSLFLLRKDALPFWDWYLIATFLGAAGMPVTGRLFSDFHDKGWMFSKVLAICLTGFAEWFLVAVGLVRFHMGSCLTTCALFVVFCGWLFFREQKAGTDVYPTDHVNLIVWEELMFLAVFLLWTYLAGFRPQAYGTEKFMDYGFMEAMMRSDVLPARDLWYSNGHINYYYGGQYFAVFLTKITGTKVEQTYNLMRMFVASIAFILPFSLVYQLSADGREARGQRKNGWVPGTAGVLSGAAVSIAGNMHYVIYACVLPFIQRLRGDEVTGYWFPDATRYIGFRPDIPDDKTIHEFPCYSFILGDLHAHVVNVMFVLLLLGILYAWSRKARRNQQRGIGKARDILKELSSGHIILAGLMLGMFRWTNYWDFIIYFVVTGAVVLFTNIIRFRGKVRDILAATVLYELEIILISTLVILPFTLKFESMFMGVGVAKRHSLPHQLLVLWGLPAIISLLLVGLILWEAYRQKKLKGIWKPMEATAAPDLYTFITALCAIGLVLIPEIVYVRDIYEGSNARANTMFKLTYQAYIMFGITVGYGIFRLLETEKKRILKGAALIGLFFLVWTMGYFGHSVKAWYGNVMDRSRYQGLDATTYLETDFQEDAQGVHWLKDNVRGTAVVLEANGDSYTGFERVSASTGLPTILGWYVHEWLWRNDPGDLNEKSADVETIYTSSDEAQVKKLLIDYGVSYIFIGSKEREKYGDRLNRDLLLRLGNIVYSREDTGTYIVQVAGR